MNITHDSMSMLPSVIVAVDTIPMIGSWIAAQQHNRV
jgi:hypothetical protein